MRVAVGVSGGADSVALLLALAARSTELGLVVHAAHLHHGLRGEEADGDLEFCRELAAGLGVPFHETRVDVGAEARSDKKLGKRAETIEETARRLRYAWFGELLASGEIDAVATAHTLDDQAETVLGKFLRGAWTEGLAGIAPKLKTPEGLETAERGGVILRPMLGTTRVEIEAYLRGLGQAWREDSSNRILTFTRNRIRHELLPLLEGWNPRLKEHLAQMAELASDEEKWWQAEIARVAPQLLLPGRPVRGGGRSADAGSAEGLAIDVTRISALAIALQRRLLRHAAEQFGISLDFSATEALRAMATSGRAGQRLELPGGLRAERTAREMRLLVFGGDLQNRQREDSPEVQYRGTIPGEIEAPAFGLRLRIEACGSGLEGAGPTEAFLRNWKPGDRVRLRYTSGPRKVKEVLERLKVTGSERALWPVIEVEGSIVWMRGVELEPVAGLAVTVQPS